MTSCWSGLSGADPYPDNSGNNSYAVLLPISGGNPTGNYAITVNIPGDAGITVAALQMPGVDTRLEVGTARSFTVLGSLVTRGTVISRGTFATGPAAMVDVDSTHLTAVGGGTLALPITSYTDVSGLSARLLSAQGSASVLDLPALTQIFGNPGVSAEAGGRINLPSLTTFDTPMFTASGSGSELSMPLVTALASQSKMVVANRGTVSAGPLIRLDWATLILRGAGTVGGGSGTNLDLSRIAKADGSSIVVESGAMAAFPSLTDYAGFNNSGFVASGSDSVIDLSALISIGSSNLGVLLHANDGATTIASNLAATSGSVDLQSLGAGSMLRIERLVHLSAGSIRVGAGGKILGAPLELRGIRVRIEGPPVSSPEEYVSLFDTRSIARIDSPAVTISSGAKVSFPSVTVIESGFGQQFLSASGAGSVLSLPGLVEVKSTQPSLTFHAESGGAMVSAPRLQAMAGEVHIRAEGSGSVVELGSIHLDQNGMFAVNTGGEVRVHGAVSYDMVDPARFQWSGAATLSLLGRDPGTCEGLEVAGEDRGSDASGWMDNFQLERLTIGPGARVELVDEVNNGNRGGVGGVPETLYVDTLVFADANGVLELNAFHLYYKTLVGSPSQITRGTGCCVEATTAEFEEDETYEISGSGGFIGDSGDRFTFLYKMLKGDFAFGLRILRRSAPPDKTSQHGLMARYSCRPAAKFSMVASYEPPIQEPRHVFRVTHGSASPVRDYYAADDGTFASRQPSWLCLIRRGTALYTYASDDDGFGNPAHWCLVGSDADPERPADLMVGVAITAGRIEFDNVFCTLLPDACLTFEAVDAANAVAGTTCPGLPAEPALVRAALGQPALNDRCTLTWTDLSVGSENLEDAYQLLWSRRNGGRSTADLRLEFSRDARVYLAWSRAHVAGGIDNSDGSVDNGWFDLTNRSGTLNEQGWYRLSACPGTGCTEDTLAAAGDADFAAGGLWCKDVDAGEAIVLRETGFSSGNPYVAFIRCGRVCTAAEEIVHAALDFNVASIDELESRGAVVAFVGFKPQVLGGRLRLTDQDFTHTAGAVWFPVPVRADIGFQVEFDAYMTAVNDVIPGDGMTFASVQGDSTFAAGLLGATDSEMGFGAGVFRDRTECHASFAVEFDTRAGGGEPENELPGTGSPGAPYTYHVGLDVDAAVTSVAPPVNPSDYGPADIFDPLGIHVALRYMPDGQVETRLKQNGVAGSPIDVVSERIPLLEGGLLLGFSAATSEYTADQEVANVHVYELDCDKGDIVILSGPVLLRPGETGLVEAFVRPGRRIAGADLRWDVDGAEARVEPLGERALAVTALSPGAILVRGSFGAGSAEDSRAEHRIAVIEADGRLRPGDCNVDGKLDLADAVCLLSHLFSGDPASLPCAADIQGPFDLNGDDALDLSDAVSLLFYLFSGGSPPALGVECIPRAGCLAPCLGGSGAG